MQERRNFHPDGSRPTPRLRLLADDLTGALDSAAQFVKLVGPVPTFWHGALPDALPASAALDSASRELSEQHAAERARALAPALVDADIAFKKIDSLLRGPTAAEIATCVEGGGFSACIIAPSFPAQGRMTRAGRQLARRDDDWHDVEVDLGGTLQANGFPVRHARPGETAPAGISLWDSETDADLALIVAAGRELGRGVLWCGTGGLAGALAGPARAEKTPALHRPLLGLFGSDQAVTLEQLRACDPHWIVLSADNPDSAAAIARKRLQATGMALASFDLPPGLARPVAAERIAAALGAVIRAVPQPGTLLVAGGETLRALCGALGATSLEVFGQLLPGVPVSRLHGGRWDGAKVVSKSGAFGDAGLLRRLVGLDAGAAE